MTKSRFKEISELQDELAKLTTVNRDLVSFEGKPQMSRAFFPGGNGLFLGETAARFPKNGILVLGSNFGGEDKYHDGKGKLVCAADETSDRSNATWNGLRLRLTEAQLENCFFTNAWPFLHRGCSNLSSVERWLKDSMLTASCVEFLKITLRLVEPKVVIALGTGPAALLSYIWPERLGPWRRYKWKHVDEVPETEVIFEKRVILCTAVTHPSLPNYRHRNEERNSFTKELEKLKSVLERAVPENG